jgi:hypothetical protein
MRFPLRQNCVDLLIDSLSDNEHSLYSNTPYIQAMKPYLASDAEVLGVFIGFEDNARSPEQIHKKYPESAYPLFNLELLPKFYLNAGYYLETRLAGTVTKTKKVGKYIFECHIDDEPMHLISLKATPLKMNLKLINN